MQERVPELGPVWVYAVKSSIFEGPDSNNPVVTPVTAVTAA